MKEKLNISINLILLLLAVLSQTEMLRETLGFPVGPLFYFLLSLLCIGLWYTAHSPRFNGIGILISLLILFLIYRLEKPDILSQLTDFFGRIANLVSERFLLSGDPHPYNMEASEYSFLFLSLAFLGAAYLAIALSSRGARTDLALLGTLPFSVFCVAVSEHPPLLPLLGMLLFWFLTAIGGSYYRKESGSSIGVLTALLPLAALLAALLLIVSPQNYEYQPPQLRFDEQLSSIGKTIRKLAEKFPHEEIELPLPAQYAPNETRLTVPSQAQQSESYSVQDSSPSSVPQEVPVNILWQDTDGKMDLTMETDSAMLDKVFLQIRASESGPVYLRALSFGDYTGTGWLPAEEPSPVSSLPFTAQALASAGAAEKQLSVRLLLSAPYRFTPYFSEDSSIYDSYIPFRDQLSYSSVYRLSGSALDSASLPQGFATDELSYRSYAHEYYTRLPDATYRALRALLEQQDILFSETKISDIAAFVQQTGQYDIEVGVYPGNDYALSFLTDIQRGYCVHFATAAAALYRAAGIPARITEGFLVHTSAGRMVDVKGKDAHAWVEIYQDGLGWLPVEVTGRSGLEPGADDSEPVTVQGAGTETVSSPAPAELREEVMPASPSPDEGETEVTMPSPIPDVTESEELFRSTAEPPSLTPSPSPSPSPSPTPQLPVGIISDPSPSGKSESSFRLIWFLVLPVLFIIALPFIRYRQRCRKAPDAHGTVIAAYNTAVSLTVFGTPLSPEIKRCAEKAAFSRNSVTDKEAEDCTSELHAALSCLNAELKYTKRLRLKLLMLRTRWYYPWLTK